MTGGESICVVFTCNKTYFKWFLFTCKQLIENGKYTGEICLVIGDDLQNDELLKDEFIQTNKIIIKYFPNINITDEFLKVNRNIEAHLQSNLTKQFQWHKLHIFTTYFKQWNYIFYIDCGTHIFSDITPMLTAAKRNKLLAHSDGYPTYERKLSGQFDKNFTELYSKLEEKFNLNIDFFQTTIMLYDTNLIEENTFDDLYKLMLEYPISKTNDQGIIALYFTCIVPVFEQIQIKNDETYFYDYLSRKHGEYKYIMLKSHW